MAQQLEVVLSMDRLECIAQEFLRIKDTGQFTLAKLIITTEDMKILPLAEQIKIVL